MDHRELADWWDEAFNEGVWWAPWKHAIEGLTAEEAAWQPAPGRHSIWQIVNHMNFWRGYLAHRLRGGEPATEEDLDRKNWEQPAEITEEAWRRARERFAESHAHVRDVLLDPAMQGPPRRELNLRYQLFHDTYHMGQIMYVRALLGKEALES